MSVQMLPPLVRFSSGRDSSLDDATDWPLDATLGTPITWTDEECWAAGDSSTDLESAHALDTQDDWPQLLERIKNVNDADPVEKNAVVHQLSGWLAHIPLAAAIEQALPAVLDLLSETSDGPALQCKSGILLGDSKDTDRFLQTTSTSRKR